MPDNRRIPVQSEGYRFQTSDVIGIWFAGRGFSHVLPDLAVGRRVHVVPYWREKKVLHLLRDLFAPVLAEAPSRVPRVSRRQTSFNKFLLIQLGCPGISIFIAHFANKVRGR